MCVCVCVCVCVCGGGGGGGRGRGPCGEDSLLGERQKRENKQKPEDP